MRPKCESTEICFLIVSKGCDAYYTGLMVIPVESPRWAGDLEHLELSGLP